jgi:hypothetical protein
MKYGSTWHQVDVPIKALFLSMHAFHEQTLSDHDVPHNILDSGENSMKQ